jgi:hypothetical protein
MNFKSTIPALVACFALGGAGAALAQSAQQNTAGTVGAGAAVTTPQGASAGGLTAGSAANRSWDHRADKTDKKNRAERRAERTKSPAEANSASTYGSGALTTTRDSANVGVTTGASAAGAGANRAGSTIDAYGETTRQGSNADLYGDSAAQSGEKPAQ